MNFSWIAQRISVNKHKDFFSGDKRSERKTRLWFNFFLKKTKSLRNQSTSTTKLMSLRFAGLSNGELKNDGNRNDNVTNHATI